MVELKRYSRCGWGDDPVGFQWVMEARERGGKVVHVDPRFTRTPASADTWLYEGSGLYRRTLTGKAESAGGLLLLAGVCAFLMITRKG